MIEVNYKYENTLLTEPPSTKEEAYKLFEINSFTEDCLTKFGGKFTGLSPDNNFGLYLLDLGIANASISYKLPSPEIKDGTAFQILQGMKCSVDILTEEDRHQLSDNPKALTQEQIYTVEKMFLGNTAKSWKIAKTTEEDIEKRMTYWEKEIKEYESKTTTDFKDSKNKEVLESVFTTVMKGTYTCLHQNHALLVKLQTLHIRVRDAIIDYCKYSQKVVWAAK